MSNAETLWRHAITASVSLLLVIPTFASAALFDQPLGSTIFNQIVQRLCQLQEGRRVRLVDPARCLPPPPPPPSASTLTLAKIVVNDNGGAAVDTAWTLSASGATPISGIEGTASTTDVVVLPGTYDLSENGPSGYSSSGWNCIGGNQTDTNTVMIAAGENVTCTITNNDVAPTLTLNKIVVNDNSGTLAESAWTLEAKGPTTISGPGGPTSADVLSGANFQAGTYTLSEDGPIGGYTSSGWSCTGGGQDGDEITVLPGENVVCTIVNDDNAPTFTVTVHKYIEGTHATTISSEGQSFPIESMWMAAGAGATTTATTSLTQSNGYMIVSAPLASSSTYTTRELTNESSVGGSCADGKPFALQGYTVGSTEAEAAGMAPDSDTPFLGNITSDMHVIIWNMDCTPQLRVTKIIVNDNGGTATTSDFALFIDGATTTSGTFVDVTVGAHLVSETNMAGYTATFGGACDVGGTVVLAAGERKECTLTNDDNPPPAPMLTVTKVIVNDSGGTATTSDFTLFIDGATTTSGVAVAVSEGVHTVTESPSASYSATFGGDCDANGNVTLTSGQSKECILTNNDVPPALPGSITIIKVVVNDNEGTATSSDFMIHLHTSPAMDDVPGSPQPGSDAGTVYSALAAGSYHVAENATTTYTTTLSGDCDAGGDITLGEGQSKTCTITNDDIPTEAGLVLISEIAWMGSMIDGEPDAVAEWMELMNTMTDDVDLDGWTLNATDSQPSITISAASCVNTVIPANGFLLLARSADDVLGVSADCTYAGALQNNPDAEDLELRNAAGDLIDNVPARTSGGWVAGDNTTKYTMQRTSSETWATAPPTPGS